MSLGMFTSMQFDLILFNCKFGTIAVIWQKWTSTYHTNFTPNEVKKSEELYLTADFALQAPLESNLLFQSKQFTTFQIYDIVSLDYFNFGFHSTLKFENQQPYFLFFFWHFNFCDVLTYNQLFFSLLLRCMSIDLQDAYCFCLSFIFIFIFGWNISFSLQI